MSDELGQVDDGNLSPREKLARLLATPEPDRTPKDRRKIANLERSIKLADRRAKLAAKRNAATSSPATPDAAADAPATAAEAVEPERTDEQRGEDLATFLRLVFRLLSPLAGVFGYERIADYTPAEAGEDATYWIGLAKRYAWFDRTIRWVAAPFVLAERVASKFKRRAVAAKPAAGASP